MGECRVSVCVCVTALHTHTHTHTQSRALVFYSTYSEEQLQPCVKKIARLIVAMPTSKQQAIKKKYSEKKFLQVAKFEALTSHIVRTLAATS